MSLGASSWPREPPLQDAGLGDDPLVRRVDRPRQLGVRDDSVGHVGPNSGDSDAHSSVTPACLLRLGKAGLPSRSRRSRTRGRRPRCPRVGDLRSPRNRRDFVLPYWRRSAEQFGSSIDLAPRSEDPGPAQCARCGSSRSFGSLIAPWAIARLNVSMNPELLLHRQVACQRIAAVEDLVMSRWVSGRTCSG